MAQLLLCVVFALLQSQAWATKGRAPIVRVDSLFKARSTPISPKAKIFLVAGSSLTAGFAQEVLDQKKLWLGAGFKEDEIACYYVVPLQEDFNESPKQFTALAPELSKCYPTSMKLLREHLKTLGEEHPSFLYLYVTSHGEKPVSEILKEAKPADEDYWALLRQKNYPIFEQYHILIEGLPDGTATSPEILGALRAGVDAHDLYMTPANLKQIFEEGFSDVPKFVVFQGCFSGGFFEDSVARPDLLSRLPKITLLSAARHDRSSFGCEPGTRTTYFGGVFNEVLSHVVKDPRHLDWPALYKTIQTVVAKLEKREKATPPSLPQFFSPK